MGSKGDDVDSHAQCAYSGHDPIIGETVTNDGCDNCTARVHADISRLGRGVLRRDGADWDAGTPSANGASRVILDVSTRQRGECDLSPPPHRAQAGKKL